jgi:histidinol phosphatase-like enzyme
MDGTPIQDLQDMYNNQQQEQMKLQAMQYNAMQNLQNEQSVSATSSAQQAQHNNYCNVNNQVKMEDLAREINDQLTNEIQELQDTQDLPDNPENFNNNSNKNKYTVYQYIPRYLVNPLIIVLVFYILSDKNVKKQLEKYIPYIREDSPNKQLGVLIYGVILAVLFVLVHKLIKKF